MTLVPVKRLRDAHYAYCPTCEFVIHSPYWGPSKSKGLHESGTRHKVVYVKVEQEAA